MLRLADSLPLPAVDFLCMRVLKGDSRSATHRIKAQSRSKAREEPTSAWTNPLPPRCQICGTSCLIPASTRNLSRGTRDDRAVSSGLWDIPLQLQRTRTGGPSSKGSPARYAALLPASRSCVCFMPICLLFPAKIAAVLTTPMLIRMKHQMKKSLPQGFIRVATVSTRMSCNETGQVSTSQPSHLHRPLLLRPFFAYGIAVPMHFFSSKSGRTPWGPRISGVIACTSRLAFLDCMAYAFHDT